MTHPLIIMAWTLGGALVGCHIIWATIDAFADEKSVRICGYFPLGLAPYAWAWRALRRWREQAWVPIHVWGPVDNGGVSEYWALAGYKDAPGLRCMSQVPDMVQRWLLRDIKRLGAQGAWDKHGAQMAYNGSGAYGALRTAALVSSMQQTVAQVYRRVSSQTATFDDVKALLGFAPSDTSADQFASVVMGMDVTQAAAHIASAMRLPSAALLQQDWRNKQYNGGPLQYVTTAVTGSGAAQQATTLSGHIRGGLASALGGALPGQMVQVPATNVGQIQQSSLIQGAMNTPNYYPGGIQLRGSQAPNRVQARAPDPVRDPYLSANDLVERLRDHLGLTQDAVARLSVKAFMLFVAIEAAKKDGEGYADLDEALHEAAGVPYVTAEQRHATAAGALYLAEWATAEPRTDIVTLYMRADMAYVISAQVVYELGAGDHVLRLRGRAPAPPVYRAYVDLANDRIVVTDGQNTPRCVGIPSRLSGGDVAGFLSVAEQGTLRSLWNAGQPV